MPLYACPLLKCNRRGFTTTNALRGHWHYEHGHYEERDWEKCLQTDFDCPVLNCWASDYARQKSIEDHLQGIHVLCIPRFRSGTVLDRQARKQNAYSAWTMVKEEGVEKGPANVSVLREPGTELRGCVRYTPDDYRHPNRGAIAMQLAAEGSAGTTTSVAERREDVEGNRGQAGYKADAGEGSPGSNTHTRRDPETSAKWMKTVCD